jgi:hypothetical protein
LARADLPFGALEHGRSSSSRIGRLPVSTDASGAYRMQPRGMAALSPGLSVPPAGSLADSWAFFEAHALQRSAPVTHARLVEHFKSLTTQPQQRV